MKRKSSSSWLLMRITWENWRIMEVCMNRRSNYNILEFVRSYKLLMRKFSYRIRWNLLIQKLCLISFNRVIPTHSDETLKASRKLPMMESTRTKLIYSCTWVTKSKQVIRSLSSNSSHKMKPFNNFYGRYLTKPWVINQTAWTVVRIMNVSLISCTQRWFRQRVGTLSHLPFTMVNLKSLDIFWVKLQLNNSTIC